MAAVSRGDPATVDGEGLARDVRRCIGREEQQGAIEFADHGHAPESCAQLDFGS